ncbi:MAG: lipopolysaccharide heptosyltransferase II [Gemmatimonadaceae bacterium]
MALVIQTSFLGDAILSTPLIAELAGRGPVDVVVTPAGATVLSGNPHVRRLIVYDKRRADRGPSGLLRTARSVRTADRDATAYLAQGSLRSALLARLAGYKQRVGFDTSTGRLLYTRRVPFHRSQHHAERLLRLALGPDTDIPRGTLRPRVYPNDSDRDAVDKLVATAPNEGRSLVALAPGSVWATKRWPYYAELAAALQATHRSVVLGSRVDTPLAAEIVRATGGDAIDGTGRLTLLGSAELIGRCRTIVTNDSAPLHLASAMNTPTIAIFGPTVPAFGFGPLADASVIAEHQSLHCRPCHPHGPMVCPLGHWRCMRDLSLVTVLARVRDLT